MPARSSGLDSIGVTATGTIDEILAADPDCLTFHGVFPDVDLYERVLESGINVVTTADWITGPPSRAPTITTRRGGRSPRSSRRPAVVATPPSMGPA